ncbi:MAG: hypothetical protein L0Y56_21690, partial [Nitrospira sp.]|nr:hypothetical protein [Nitrospira sp.]
RQYILNHTIKICDSGIFTREGATLSYREMFEAYKRMGVEYGIMIDVFQDAQATLISAREALEVYEPYRDTFNLVGVAHGLTVEEYLECYRGLRELGFTYIAVGGLLHRVEETVRYTQVRDEDFMYEVIGTIRAEFPDDWLFALGCFHPGRLQEFQARNVWGDYKGWIFQYRKRNEMLTPLLSTFALNHLTHLEGETLIDQIAGLQDTIERRNETIERQETLSQQLNQGKRTLRALLRTLHQQVINSVPELANRFGMLTTHGLLKPNEENLVYTMLQRLNIDNTDQARHITVNIRQNRDLKETINDLDRQIEQTNESLIHFVDRLRTDYVELPHEIYEACATILDIVQETEQEHRLQQVRQKMSEEILNLL